MKLCRVFALVLLMALSSLLVFTRAEDNGETKAPKDDGDTTDPPAPTPDDETEAPAPVPPDDTTDQPTPPGPEQQTGEPTPAATTEAPTPAPQTLDVVLKGESDLTTLVVAIEAADLLGALNDTTAELTVFAPIDSAFEKLGDTADKLLTAPWSLHLQNLLLFHVTDRLYLSDDLQDDQLDMLNGESIDVLSTGNPENGTEVITLTSPVTEEALVTTANLTASNGVAHKIDSVLLPEWAGISALEYASANRDFSTLVQLVNTSGLTIPSGGITLLAPTNDAFDALPEEELLFYTNPNNTQALADLLAGHVFNQVYPSSSLSNGMDLTSLAGTTVTVMTEQQGQRTNVMFNDAQVGAANILVNDGIIHSIDSVLLPSTLAPTTSAAPSSTTKAPAAGTAAPSKAPSPGGGDGVPTGPTPPTPPTDLTLSPVAPSAAPVDSGAVSFLKTKILAWLFSCMALLLL